MNISRFLSVLRESKNESISSEKVRSTMSQLNRYIDRYGAVAGPKLYHAIRSRSAYMGANSRRRATIARLSSQGSPPPARVASGRLEATSLLPFGPDGDPIAG